MKANNPTQHDFEAWLITWWPQAKGNLDFQNGEYSNHFLNYAWEGWKACAIYHKAQQQIILGWKLVPIEPTKEMVAAGQDKFEECIDYGFDSCEDGSTHEYSKILSYAPYQVNKAMIAAAPQVE